MNIVLLKSCELGPDNEFVLGREDRRNQHIRKILKAQPGQSLAGGLLGGRRASLLLRGWDAEGSLRGVFTARPDETAAEFSYWENPRPLRIVMGLLRPHVMKRLLKDLASMGVGEICFVHSSLAEGDYQKSSVWERAEEHLILGAEQGRLTCLPKLEYFSSLKSYWQWEEENAASHLKFVLEQTSADSFETLRSQQCKVRQNSSEEKPPFWTLAVGPERGWTERELAGFHAAGFTGLSLGTQLTLRAEVAAHLAAGLYFLVTGS